MPTLAPRVAAFPNEANLIAPRRRGAPIWHGENSSDGGYVNKPGGHNIGARGLVHAWDISQSMPGTPYWEPKFQQFDVWSYCYRIAAEYTAATDAERQRRWPWLYDGGYMVWFDGTKDIIFGPKHDRDLGQEPHIRQNGDFKTEHFQHAHLEAAETIRAEQDTQPIFGAATAPPAHEEDLEMTEAELRTMLGYTADNGVRVEGLLDDAIDHQFGAYDQKTKKYEPGLLKSALRKLTGTAK